METSVAQAVVGAYSDKEDNDVPFVYRRGTDGVDVNLGTVFGHIKGLIRPIARTDDELSQVLSSIKLMHSLQGFELRVDACGARRRRLCCALRPHTDSQHVQDKPRQRDTSTKRHNNCDVCVTFLRNKHDNMWYVSCLLPAYHAQRV